MKTKDKPTKREKLMAAYEALENILGPDAEISAAGVVIGGKVLDVAKDAWLVGELSLTHYSAIASDYGLPTLTSCKTCYEPAGRAREYARLATNPYKGCTHGCTYCYCPGVLRMKPKDFFAKSEPRERFLEKLERDLKRWQAHGITSQVMLSFTTDPYNHHNEKYNLTRAAIQLIHNYGLGVSVLSKGGIRALADIDLFEPGRDSYGVTLTSYDEARQKRYEPFAAPTAERVETLMEFKRRGIHTWVSLEPVLSLGDVMRVIKGCALYTDLFKVGKMNYAKTPEMVDWAELGKEVVSELNRLGHLAVDGTQDMQTGYYIKEDLREIMKRAIGTEYSQYFYDMMIEGKL